MFRLLVACLADDEVLAVMCRWALDRAGGGAGRRPPLQLGLFFWVTMRSFIGLRQPQMHFVLPLLPLLQGLSQETIEFVLSHPSNAYDRCVLPAERCAHGSVCAHSACTAPPGEMAAGCGAWWTRLLAAVKACRHRPSLTQPIFSLYAHCPRQQHRASALCLRPVPSRLPRPGGGHLQHAAAAGR